MLITYEEKGPLKVENEEKGVFKGYE